MRKYFFISLFFSLNQLAQAQNSTADSLQLLEIQMNIPADSLERQLLMEKDGIARVGLLGYLCFYYAWVDPKKSLDYGQQGMQLSYKLNYKKGSAYCKQSLSFCLWVVGNFNEALRMALKSLQEYEDLQDYKRIAYSYLALANIYREIGEYTSGLAEAKKAIRINDSINFSQRVAYVVIGSIYERQNQLDSALRYMQKAYELDIIENKGRWGFLIYVLGNIQLKIGNFELALAYYRMALPLVAIENVPKDLVDIYNSLAVVFKATGRTDSCIFYASEIVQKWRSTDYKQGILKAVGILAEIYRVANQRDSIIKYLEMSVALNKELFTKEKEREFQNLLFNEQLRRQEKEQSEVLAAEERRKNIKLVAIAAFIITFMVGVIVISRRRSLLKTARFLGLIGVLLIFEFISLIIHPTIERITHHDPVLTLLTLVMLASILVPAHHYLEDVIKKKLVRRRRTKQTKLVNAVHGAPKTESKQ